MSLVNGGSLSVAVLGSGGTGALTVGNLLFEASARMGCYGFLTRSVGPQIRGGEAAALMRLSAEPVDCVDDRFDILLAMDWKNADRHAAEIPLGPASIIITDPAGGEVPGAFANTGARVHEVRMGEMAKQIANGRTNMVVLGTLAEILELPEGALLEAMRTQLGSKGEQVLQSSGQAADLGRRAAAEIGKHPLPRADGNTRGHWMITGNEAAGLGAVRGGIRFVAAYPITPATDLLEWLSPALARVGGMLVQAEDELASANMVIGASFGGVPALTATSGPGLSLMMESLGLAVSSEIPIVVVDVMRGGPSTGIPTKSEQGDLNIAVYGFHGDAPHLVLAPTSIADCLFTCQWSVYLAEALQAPAIVLSDQLMGQARTVINPPADFPFRTTRNRTIDPDGYRRYAITESGISPMAIPGTPGGQYTADGLEHSPGGLPSARAEDHAAQLDKRLRKISAFDYGGHWADLEGRGKFAIITWGSMTCVIREALRRLQDENIADIRLLAMRLLSPAQPARFAAALEGVERVLIIEQNHSGQFFHYLRAHYELPGTVESFHRPGPSLIRPGELAGVIRRWRTA